MEGIDYLSQCEIGITNKLCWHSVEGILLLSYLFYMRMNPSHNSHVSTGAK